MASNENIQALCAACESVAAGRRIARTLSAVLRPLGLSETEFRLLHELANSDSCASSTIRIDQTTLCHRLVSSPGQMSAMVEKLRTRGLITADTPEQDRRRQFWTLTEAGRQLFEDAANLVSQQTAARQNASSKSANLCSVREDAA